VTKPFDPTKPVQTRDGRKARIIATDIEGEFPIAVAITWKDGDEVVGSRFSDGSYASSRLANPADLVNIPEVTKEFRRVWVSRSIHVSEYANTSEELCRAGAGRQKYLGIFVIEKTDGEISDSYFIPWEKKQ